MSGLIRRQRKQWLGDLIEWSGKVDTKLVKLTENRPVYEPFVYGVAHAREMVTVRCLPAT